MFGFFYFYKMEEDQKETLVYVTKRPEWHYILALPFYLSIIPLAKKIVELVHAQHSVYALRFLVVIFLVFICAAGLTFTKKVYTHSAVKSVRFSFTLFGIPLTKDIVFKNVKHISVYKNHSDRDYEVLIWLSETKKGICFCSFR